MPEQGGEVFLTGATGFVGSHVLTALLSQGFHVRALVRPESRPRPAEGCRYVYGDIRRAGELIDEMRGCRYLMHVAALYSFAPSERREMYLTNVKGCAGLLEAARIAGIERAVVTSSSATVGPMRGNVPADENDWAGDLGAASTYHRSKIEQERVALAAQLPVVLVLPTAPVGPGDARPTPTGKMLVDFMRGRIFGTLPGGLNVAPVEDIGRAHVLALRLGRERERYLVGGENMSLNQLWERLAAVCNRRAPRRSIPYAAALTFGWVDEMRCRLLPGSQPVAPLEGVHMGREYMYVSDAKARNELGYTSTSVEDALTSAVAWYRGRGYV